MTDAIAQYSRWARTMAQPWNNALAARCHAMTTSGSDAEQHHLYKAFPKLGINSRGDIAGLSGL